MSGDEIQRLSKELDELKKAGGMLAEAATHVVTHYDGVHRLRLALAHWHKTMADEFGRGSMAEKPLLAEAPAQSSAQISKCPASAKDLGTDRYPVPKKAVPPIPPTPQRRPYASPMPDQPFMMVTWDDGQWRVETHPRNSLTTGAGIMVTLQAVRAALVVDLEHGLVVKNRFGPTTTNYHAIRGREFGWLYIDECRDMSREGGGECDGGPRPQGRR